MKRHKIKTYGKHGKRVRRKFNKSVAKTKKANIVNAPMRGGYRF